ncbi:MAG: hypothetical protein DWP92_01630 [Armatimonadetes bacterium]|nr:MAG: hypothetical protein DWP92_01630 [Armatimonadota bacterium]
MPGHIARQTSRKAFDDSTRLSLLETDADEMAADIAAIRTLLQRLTWAIVGAGITFSTSSILLAINLTVNT